MSRSSKRSVRSSVEEDLRAMLECDEYPADDILTKPKRAEVTKSGQDWKTLPDEFIKTFSKPSKSKAQKKPPNVWGFPQAQCIQHQTQNAPCNCGIGTGFSLFLENIDNKEFASHVDVGNFHADPNKPRNPAKNIATLIPEELHVKRYNRTSGLELLIDEHTTIAEGHGHHDMVVPRRTPATREDVARLKNIFKRLLQEAGLGESLQDVVITKRTNSEIENLIELVRAEQEVYNIVFHEIIRQVTVDCTDRGEILAELREFYARLLNRMPRLFMTIHQENIIQRSLDRRLMEELLHFKIRLVQVVFGLGNVHHVYQKTHGRMCTAQEELKHALLEAQKASMISDQLHGLYKMQKERQQAETASCARQREFWKGAACALMSKVVETYKLGLFRLIITSLDAWTLFMHKIMEEREAKDNEQVQFNFYFLQDWAGKVEDTIAFMSNREQRTYSFANSMWHSIDRVANQLKAAVNVDPAEFEVVPSEGAKRVTLHKALVQWASKFTVDLAQIDDGLTDSAKASKYLGRLEGIRESFRFQTENHILLTIRDESFNNDVTKVYDELKKVMKALYPVLEESFYKGIDPMIHQTEIAVRMWAKRNMRVDDLPRLQQDLAYWSMNLQRACDITGFMMWNDKKTVYDVVREKVMLKIGDYRTQVIDSLAGSLQKQKLDLNEVHDTVTQWVVQCLVLAAPPHPTLTEGARKLIEKRVMDVKQLSTEQKRLKGLMEQMTVVQDRSLVLVQEQGGRIYESGDMEPAELSPLFRAECSQWCELSETCIQKLKKGEEFESEVTTRCIGIGTDPPPLMCGNQMETEDITELNYADCPFVLTEDDTGTVPESAEETEAEEEGDGYELSAHTQILSEVTNTSVVQSQSLKERSPNDDPKYFRALPKSTMSTDVASQTLLEGNSSSIRSNNSKSCSKLFVGSSTLKAKPSKTSGNLKGKATHNLQTVPTPSTGSPYNARHSSIAISPRSSAQTESSQTRLNTLSGRCSLGGSFSPFGERLGPAISQLTSDGLPTPKESRGPSTSTRRSKLQRRTPRRRLTPEELSLVPEVAVVRRAMLDASTMTAMPQQDRPAQTNYTGHLHTITFPDFMIEMFASQLKRVDTDEPSAETEEEHERMTALQLNNEQMVFLQQRLDERERHVLDLQHRLATTKDDIKELKHQLNVTELRLKNATARLQQSSEASSAAASQESAIGGSAAAAVKQIIDSTARTNSSRSVKQTSSVTRRAYAARSASNVSPRTKTSQGKKAAKSVSKTDMATKAIHGILSAAGCRVPSSDVSSSRDESKPEEPAWPTGSDSQMEVMRMRPRR